jgi:hypothetical protein
MFLVKYTNKVVVRKLTREKSDNKIIKEISSKNYKTYNTIYKIINIDIKKGQNKELYFRKRLLASYLYINRL